MRTCCLFLFTLVGSLLFGQNSDNKKCSEFIGGQPGEVDYYMQLCYDSTFYYHEWHVHGKELVDEGFWWFNREASTIVLNSQKLTKESFAYYESKKVKCYLFDSIPYLIKNGMIHLFEEDWDTIPFYRKHTFVKKMLCYLVKEEIDSVEIKREDSIRSLGPFHRNPIYVKIFRSPDSGLLRIKNKMKEKKEERTNRKAEVRKQKALEEQEKEMLEVNEKADKDAKKKGKNKERMNRLQYIQEMNEKRRGG